MIDPPTRVVRGPGVRASGMLLSVGLAWFVGVACAPKPVRDRTPIAITSARSPSPSIELDGQTAQSAATSGASESTASEADAGLLEREAEQYRQDVRSVLHTRSPAITACYDEHLLADPTAGGSVEIRFTVEARSGRFRDFVVDEASTAPLALQHCLVDALAGLHLSPADRRNGEATFTWRFGPPPSE